MDINTAMVSSMICTGQGYAQLAEMSAILNIPPMANQTFLNTQANLASAIHDVAWEEMKKAAMEESELAIKANEVDKDGIPLITVVCDGSWAKRSYCTNYNSLSGVACIVGFRSKKVIFIGVRNKYCCICSQAISKDPTTEARPHICFKNWNSSSTAMEADIIAEGFKNSVTMYNLKYNRLLGDGDSSIMQRLGRVIPYGIDLPVQKVECSNHLLRNYCNRIREVVKKPNNWKGHVPATIRKNVGDNLPPLRNVVSSAIKFQKNAPTPDSASLQY
ncbi:uncharacterized protein LOC124160096 [Ischnura elegans]|uniref:uncharacterized protein LOC124160096 n=1 Tax=Ischnura elegans TaxID=197161 RepID=UPI001ED8676F|nr:uncharacterized protein LOC124160096 [Ischnura elegans]XP_046391776.1 uncharacterized protein LOC124160096 [Ischnura elegans]